MNEAPCVTDRCDVCECPVCALAVTPVRLWSSVPAARAPCALPRSRLDGPSTAACALPRSPVCYGELRASYTTRLAEIATASDPGTTPDRGPAPRTPEPPGTGRDAVTKTIIFPINFNTLARIAFSPFRFDRISNRDYCFIGDPTSPLCFFFDHGSNNRITIRIAVSIVYLSRRLVLFLRRNARIRNRTLRS
jgi:hypothetical protein